MGFEATNRQRPRPVAKSEEIAFRHTLLRYQIFGSDRANVFDGSRFHKVITLDGDRLVLLELYESDGRIWVQCRPGIAETADWTLLHRHARTILGLDFDLGAFTAFARSDRVLRQLTATYSGMRPTLFADPFEMLIGAIAAQQINLKFAFKVKAQLTTAFGRELSLGDNIFFAFPSPRRLLAAGTDGLHAAQLTRRKSEYVIGLCQAIVAGDFDPEALSHLSHDDIVNRITAIRGLGRWTADWFMARGLGRGAVCPVGDLGVARAIRYYYPQTASFDEAQLRDFTVHWGDHANLATHYLLRGWMERKRP